MDVFVQFINSGFLANVESKESFEEAWKKLEPYLCDNVFFSDARPFRKFDSFVSGKKYLKYKLKEVYDFEEFKSCLLYTSPSPRD